MDPTMGAVGLTSGSESMIDEIGLEFQTYFDTDWACITKSSQISYRNKVNAFFNLNLPGFILLHQFGLQKDTGLNFSPQNNRSLRPISNCKGLIGYQPQPMIILFGLEGTQYRILRLLKGPKIKLEDHRTILRTRTNG